MKIELSGGNSKWEMAFAREADYRKAELGKAGICGRADLEKAGLKLYKAEVPGNFELDLQRNGIIEEPFYGTNALALHKYEDSHIWYRTEFTLKKGISGGKGSNSDTFLVFEGLDTYAEIFLNGRQLGTADNMLIPHVIPLKGYELARDGGNELLVHIKPAAAEASKYGYSVFEHAPKYGYEALYVRKAPHMYGWDIMPRIVSAGIWKPVYIDVVPKERIEEIYFQTVGLVNGGNDANILCNYNVRADDPLVAEYELKIEGSCGESKFTVGKKLQFCAGSLSFRINGARLWWPEGKGEACLYSIKASLIKGGKVLDIYETRLGVRTVKLKKTSTTDAAGSGEFCFYVNGEKVFAKGTNWVPADAFHSRDRERIPKILGMARDLKCNIIRCWGGNVYEDDVFYDICDEYGIMVWQDFTMACAIYPQDDKFAARLGAEAEVIIKRLRQHPCIILWAGDNECDCAYASWSGIMKDPNLNILTRKVLPEAVRRHDPMRDYLPSSPYIDEEAFNKGRDTIPENHLWGPRNYFKSDFYRKAICHFASEIGYHGMTSVESMKKFISPESMWPYQDNREWLMHSSSVKLEQGDPHHYRIELMARQVREMFGFVPDNLEEYVKASQISQAEAFKFFIEFFRGRKWRTSGIIWWNLMDGWPQFSDAVVDYYFDKKLAYDYIKISHQHVCIIIKEAADASGVLAGTPGKDGMPLLESADKAPETFNEVVVSNDTRRGVNIEYEISDADSGETILKGTTYAAPDSNTSLGKVSFSGNAGKPAFYVIRWTAGVAKAAGTAASATAGVASAATGAAGAGSAGAAVVRGINHYMTGIPAPVQKSEEELKAVFGQYLKWLDIYMAEVRDVLS